MYGSKPLAPRITGGVGINESEKKTSADILDGWAKKSCGNLLLGTIFIKQHVENDMTFR